MKPHVFFGDYHNAHGKMTFEKSGIDFMTEVGKETCKPVHPFRT